MLPIEDLILRYPLAFEWGGRIFAVFFILLGGHYFARFVYKVSKKILRSSDIDELLGKFLANLANIFTYIILLIAIMELLHIPTAPFAAVIGAGGLAIGFALRDTITNFASGALLVFFKPFKVGDMINLIEGSGEVKEIQAFSTILKTPDSIRLIIPNGKIFGGVIKNFSAEPSRRLDVVVSFDPTQDLAQAQMLLEKLLKKESAILPEPTCNIYVAELSEVAATLSVHPWFKTNEYKDASLRLVESIYDELKKAEYNKLSVKISNNG